MSKTMTNMSKEEKRMMFFDMQEHHFLLPEY